MVLVDTLQPIGLGHTVAIIFHTKVTPGGLDPVRVYGVK